MMIDDDDDEGDASFYTEINGHRRHQCQVRNDDDVASWH